MAIIANAWTGGVYDKPVRMPHFIMRRREETGDGAYPVDACFPLELVGTTDTSSVDEGTAALLGGLIQGLRPKVILETGTHKGRSTRAMAAALRANAELTLMPYTFVMLLDKGHLWTVDEEDYGLMTSGAIREGERPFVTQVIGRTPEIFTQPPLDGLQGIEFAFLDGDHTPDGLDADLTYVDLHRAKECLVAIDNSRDPGWAAVGRYLAGYHKHPRISLPTCTGLDLIWMTG
jgi:Methyltransferase domain